MRNPNSPFSLFPGLPSLLPPQDCRNTVGPILPHTLGCHAAVPSQLFLPSCLVLTGCIPWVLCGRGEEGEANFLPLAETSSSQGLGGLFCRGAWCLTLASVTSEVWLGSFRVTIVNTGKQPGHPSVKCQPCASWAWGFPAASWELLSDFPGVCKPPPTKF